MISSKLKRFISAYNFNFLILGLGCAALVGAQRLLGPFEDGLTLFDLAVLVLGIVFFCLYFAGASLKKSSVEG